MLVVSLYSYCLLLCGYGILIIVYRARDVLYTCMYMYYSVLVLQ